MKWLKINHLKQEGSIKLYNYFFTLFFIDQMKISNANILYFGL